MLHSAIPLALLALAAPAAVAPDEDARAPHGVVVTQMTIHERIIIRLPRMGPTAALPSAAVAPRAPIAPPLRWKEKKGPTCIAAVDLGGALFSQPGSIDLMLTGNRRVRARYAGDCSALDFYSGVYLRPAADGMICADRDSIRTRSGASCQIDAFRTLKPAR